MSGSFQQKLQRHEETPPPTVWNKIAKQLDEEFLPSDSRLSSTLESASIDPPEAAWLNIASALHPEKTGRLVAFPFKRIAVAAIVTGILVIGALFFFNNGTPDDSPRKTQMAVVPAQPAPDSSDIATAPLPDVQGNTRSSKIRVASPPVVRHAAYHPRVAVRQAVTKPTFASFAGEASLPTLQPQPTLPSITVSAPPIKDESGHIIMDLKLITEPDEQYITVTSPSGDQTRISNKFINCLSYINGNASAADIDARGAACQAQFDRWRKKLLSEAAFIPTASNFLDIFEFRDLIQD
jgi:hypothetical protein